MTVTGLLTGAIVEASVNLPTHHWAYEAIERLTALGIIDRAMVVTKPYSRKQAAKAVARGLERIRKNQAEDDGVEVIAGRLLERLVREFRPELVDLSVLSTPPGASRAGAIRYGARAQVEVDGFQVGVGEVRLRENRGGEYYADGAQVQADVRGWLELQDWAAFVVQPKFISNPHALGIGATDNSHNIYLREFNLKLSRFNIALEVGRGLQWWGPGYHGTLLLSDHAFPLDMIKLGSEEPFRLPWFLQSLGQWKINTFLTRLERDRDFPRAQVFGLRISYMPADWLELGAARLTQFDGRGHSGGDQYFPAIIFDSYTHDTNKTGLSDVNEQAMFDFRARVPSVPYLVPFPSGMQLYGELGFEDPPYGLGIVTGIYIPQLFKGDTMDLRIEYADTDLERRLRGKTSAWYDNVPYVSGMRYRGYPLGHWMGTDGIDFFVRTTRYLTETLQIGSNLDLSERARGLPVHERKVETSADLTWWISNRMQISVSYVYQRIHNPGQITSINPFVESFAPNVLSINHFLWTNFAFEF